MTSTDLIMDTLGAYYPNSTTRREPRDADLTDFEHQLKAPLPEDYRRFLACYGGVAFRQNAEFAIQDPCPWGQSGQIGLFLGFSTRQEDDIVHLTMRTFASGIPDETIPIATDPGGNLVVLGVLGMVKHHVFFWDHDHCEQAGRMDELLADVEAKGLDTRRLDSHSLIRRWELLYPERRTKPVGYGNVYRVANTFAEFLEGLYSTFD